MLRVKRLLFGRPLTRAEEENQLLPKTLALPVFASDPLSSVAYATEESMLVLALAGPLAFSLLGPISAAIAALLLIVIVSYQQTIRAYPDGGGAFIVSSQNLGLGAGKVAASALLTDYVLTVAVSVAAGVAAITSAVPALLERRVVLSLVFVALLTVANLRGVKEASTLFALPTYLFVATVFVLLGTGLIQCVASGCRTAATSGLALESEVPALTLFLLLRAFASGATALTGVEAIANGVQAFKEPKSHNAAFTLGVMGAISISMFLGISTLAQRLDVRISESTIDDYGTVLSQIGRTVFGGGAGFYALQVATAAILVLAANTAYQDFPRLSAILARHRLVPRQYRNRGDRLVFSNGVLTLAVLATLLLILFDAQVGRLIQLYVVGVFTSFTLSQAGMVRHWLTTREPGWRRSVVINAIGSATTGVVLVVVAVVKFTHGAWIVTVAIPILVALMTVVRRHYLKVAEQLKRIPPDASPRPNRTLVLVAHHDAGTERALEYAGAIRSDETICIHAEDETSDRFLFSWVPAHDDAALEVLPAGDGSIVSRLVRRIRDERDRHPDHTVTVVLSERVGRRPLWDIVRHRHSLAIKARLLWEPRVVVTDVTYRRRRARAALRAAPTVRAVHYVLVSDLTRPIREALTYSIGLGVPVRAVHIDIDEEQRRRLEKAWETAGFDIPLDLVGSRYRSIVDPLVEYVQERRREALPGTLICAVIPEFVVAGRVTQFLHNQTGLAIKRALAAVPSVAVVDVPFHLVSRPALSETNPLLPPLPGRR